MYPLLQAQDWLKNCYLLCYVQYSDLEEAEIRHEGTLIAVTKKRKEYTAKIAALLGKTTRLQKNTVVSRHLLILICHLYASDFLCLAVIKLLILLAHHSFINQPQLYFHYLFFHTYINCHNFSNKSLCPFICVKLFCKQGIPETYGTAATLLVNIYLALEKGESQ